VFRIIRNLITPAIISLVLLLPFTVLELVNRRRFSEGFPIALFALMWALTFSFIVILVPVMRGLREGDEEQTSPLALAPKVILLTLIASLWGFLVIDQMPCFLGVLNCD
jgi:hypothetical protein